MSNKAKKANETELQKAEAKKELERRIEEEQRLLLKRQKSAEKDAPKKKRKPEPELSDKIKPRKKAKEEKEGLHKKVGYQIPPEEQARALDYAALFNYLGNLKQPRYDYSNGTPDAVKIAYKKNETISWEEINRFTDEWKMDKICNINRSFETTDRRQAYIWWKSLNMGMAHFLYEISLT